MSAGAPITAPPRTGFSTLDRPTWDLYSTCIHCGLCLQSCPTYRVLGLEADSPRGRIYQVLQVDAGNLAIGESFVTHIDRCLGCRACETACPSGVHYGAILERARAEIETNYRRPWLARAVRSYAYRRLLTDFRALTRWARLLRFYQRSGLQRLARASGMLRLLGLADVERLAPRVDDDFFLRELGAFYPAQGTKRGSVALLAGCIASVTFSELNRATIRVLNHNGVDVLIPENQGCCGALHAHAGLREDARALARHNIEAFLSAGVDAIVTNAAGCGATLKEYNDLLSGDAAFAERAAQFSHQVKDIHEYLAEIGVLAPERARASIRVTYQDSCHLAHGQGVRAAPRELLRAAGVELVEMAHAELCCGSAGTYNVTENALSMQILGEKMDDISSVQPDVIATANVGCILQLRAGVEQRGLSMRVLHVVEVLDEAYGGRESALRSE